MNARLIVFTLLLLCVPARGDAPDDAGTGRTDGRINGETGLMAAAKAADTERLESLIEQGADVNLANANGGTPIMYAALSGEPETVALLLEHDARVDAVARNGWTALMIASVKGYVEVAQLLLEHGANPNGADMYAWTPLMRAVFENRLAVVRLLTSHQAVRVNQRGENGVTALHLAALKGSVDSVKLLLGHGADPTITDDSDRSALDFARQNNNWELLRMMNTGLTD